MESRHKYSDFYDTGQETKKRVTPTWDYPLAVNQWQFSYFLK